MSPRKATISTPAKHRQHEDAVGEGEAVALVHELPRQEAVARDDRGEPREVGVRRVRREHEDHRRRRLHQVVENRPAAEDRAAELRDARLGCRRQHVVGVGENGDADEHRDGEDGHRHERRRGVLRLGRRECRDAVRDGLDARHRRAAVGERRQQQEASSATAAPRARRKRPSTGDDRAGDVADRARPAMRPRTAHDEEIGRHGEDAARFADAAQVADHQEREERRGRIRRGRRRACGNADVMASTPAEMLTDTVSV